MYRVCAYECVYSRTSKSLTMQLRKDCTGADTAFRTPVDLHRELYFCISKRHIIYILIDHNLIVYIYTYIYIEQHVINTEPIPPFDAIHFSSISSRLVYHRSI